MFWPPLTHNHDCKFETLLYALSEDLVRQIGETHVAFHPLGTLYEEKKQRSTDELQFSRRTRKWSITVNDNTVAAANTHRFRNSNSRFNQAKDQEKKETNTSVTFRLHR